jgi:hypothetical protein
VITANFLGGWIHFVCIFVLHKLHSEELARKYLHEEFVGETRSCDRDLGLGWHFESSGSIKHLH